MDDGRVSDDTGLSQAEPQEGLGPSGFDPSRAKKAVYFDMTVRALREMIESEREWATRKAVLMARALEGDIEWQYAHIGASEVVHRATRLSVLSDILDMMTRNFAEPRDSDEGGDGEAGSVHDSAGLEEASPKGHPDA